MTHSESIVINATPEAVYAVVSDVTRTGEWSPICEACWWDDGAGPSVGSWFTGRNVKPDRTWETRSQVTVADPGRAFEWSVGEGYVNWQYSMKPVAGGTELTESWEFTPAGQAYFVRRYGDDAPRQIESRREDALSGIPATLAAIKRIVEQA